MVTKHKRYTFLSPRLHGGCWRLLKVAVGNKLKQSILEHEFGSIWSSQLAKCHFGGRSLYYGLYKNPHWPSLPSIHDGLWGHLLDVCGFLQGHLDSLGNVHDLFGVLGGLCGPFHIHGCLLEVCSYLHSLFEVLSNLHWILTFKATFMCPGRLEITTYNTTEMFQVI